MITLCVMGFGRGDFILELYVILLVEVVLSSPSSYFLILPSFSVVCLPMARPFHITMYVALLCQLHILFFLCTGSPWFVMMCFVMIHSNNGFETRRPKISKSIPISKMCSYKYQICVKKQHSQSWMRLIKLLK